MTGCGDKKIAGNKLLKQPKNNIDRFIDNDVKQNHK